MRKELIQKRQMDTLRQEGVHFFTLGGRYKDYGKEDGSFSIYDAEAGNPGICGKMKIDSEDTITLICDDNEDFDS